MQIELSELSIVALIGLGNKETKSFVKQHFSEQEVLNLGQLEDQGVKLLEEVKLVTVDVSRKPEEAYNMITKLAKKYHYTPVAMIFYNTSIDQEEIESLEKSLNEKGFKKIYRLGNLDELNQISIKRIKLANNKKEFHGPFDIIGDIHGCYDELCELLQKLGYSIDQSQEIAYSEENRKLVFLGDLVDRGPKVTKVLKLVMNMIKEERAYCVLGNHDGKLLRKLKGANVQVIHGLEETLRQLEGESSQFIEELKQFLNSLVSHYVFDDGKLVVAHAGLKEELQGRESKKIRDLAMFGVTTGKLDKLGLPIRLDWSKNYRGKAFVVYGHTPQAKAKIINNTINIDTGCVFGGKLTAFRYPEREIVEVEAKRVYYESVRPFL